MKVLAHAGSRRQFLKSAAAATAALWVRPYPLYAQHEGDHLVRLIRDEAATAEIVVRQHRGLDGFRWQYRRPPGTRRSATRRCGHSGFTTECGEGVGRHQPRSDQAF